MVLGNAASKLETFLWTFNYVYKSVIWSLFNLKESNLDRWSISIGPFIREKINSRERRFCTIYTGCSRFM